MPKPSKSSATSGTRKKHARKAGGDSEPPELSQPVKSKPSKKQIKKGLAPPPKKTYIPPSKLKPTAHEVDPLDGLDSLLPSELVLILKRLGKKDAITKSRALEELENWIQEAKNEKIEYVKSDSLVNMLPVWLYRYPALSIHASRKIRHLAAAIQALLIEFPRVRTEIVSFMDYGGSESGITRVLGCWCLSRWDVDRSVGLKSQRSWTRIILSEQPRDVDDESSNKPSYIILDINRMVNDLLPFLITSVMDPAATHLALYPSAPHAIPPNFQAHHSQSKTLPRYKPPVEFSSKSEEDQESAEDRNARIRISALNALSWIISEPVHFFIEVIVTDYVGTSQPLPSLSAILLPLFSSPTFWSILYYSDNAPYLPQQEDSDPLTHFGTNQPAVRRAGWGVVNNLFADPGLSRLLAWINKPDLRHATLSEDSALRLISFVILRSAFVEPDPLVKSTMWEPFLVYITKVDNAWILSSEYGRSQHAALEDNSDNEQGPEASQVKFNDIPMPYVEFQSFLSLGCNGSPLQGYPTVLVILSTIPQEILPLTIDALSGFFDALWSAIDGQALVSLSSERIKASHAFIEAWSECLLWITGRLIKGSSPSPSATEGNVPKDIIANTLVDTQFKRLFSDLWGNLRVDAEVVGQTLANTLQKLELTSSGLLGTAWLHVSEHLQSNMEDSEKRVPEQILSFFASLYHHSKASSVIQTNIEDLITGSAIDAVSRWTSTIQEEGYSANEEVPKPDKHRESLRALLEHFGEILKTNAKFIEMFNDLITAFPIAFASEPSLVLAYLKHTNPERRVTIWTNVLQILGCSSLLSIQSKMSLLNSFIHSDQTVLQTLHEPDGQGLLTLIDQIMDEALTGDQPSLDLIVTLLRQPKPFITMDAVHSLISSTVIALDYQLQPMIRGSSPSIEILTSSLRLLLELGEVLPVDDLPAPIKENTLPHLFVLGFILPDCRSFEEAEEVIMNLAKRLWEIWHSRADSSIRNAVLLNTKRCLKDLITDTRSKPQPINVLESLKYLDIGTDFQDVLPTEEEYLLLLSNTPSEPIDKSLAVLDFFVSCSQASTLQGSDYDQFGFSPYARAVKALLYVVQVDRQFARSNIWTLQHIITLANFATEALRMPHITHPVFFNQQITTPDLKEIVQASHLISAYILASAAETSSWHIDVVNAVSQNRISKQLDPIGQFVYSLCQQTQETDTYRESSVLYKVLQHILPNADKTAADKWVDLTRQIEPQAFRTSLVISRAISEFASESQKLDRLRNELASKLSAVSPSKANTNGVRLLRGLAAVAPHPDSDVIFLPQQRAVYVVQTLQTWFGSDEDMNDAVECDATLVVYYLALLLQTVQGSHWEFILDLLENNLEESLVLLSRSLQLTNLLLDITKSNKYLRELWSERSKTIFGLVRNLLEAPTGFLQNAPVSACREQALSLVQELPTSLVDRNTLSSMCHLLKDSSVENQKLAYFLLQQAAFKRTEHLVVEAAVDTQENEATIVLPQELLSLLQTNVGLDTSVIRNEEALSYLLSWMLCFDLFVDASLKVKTAYIDHMRELDLIGLYFLPNVLGILDVASNTQAFKLDHWTTDEYWLPMYDADVPYSLQLLAAHVYYRGLLTVPSLIRTWWEDLKDRQLSSAIASYTSTYFSPVLVASEFIHLNPTKRAEAGEEPLGDDTFKVKIAQAINEVTATFLVDEQQMEIGVKLPAGYPLRTIEVKPIKRVGVHEKTWRRWLFAVQQVITTHNGRIVDGLVLFKKTANLHFEGQAECAICYSHARLAGIGSTQVACTSGSIRVTLQVVLYVDPT
ncbi:hypothetical protein Clacol_004809 [Clathrus columnatus]|uniref:E3 ubiquitin-protein ligase listerin n=1 Tax=Clathrus columnatus TaxID=1419009 RepID=A0AAV5AA51_9AGAM|nr:hypothetical protein Clacol_004809 [Clathrus columnatus]